MIRSNILSYLIILLTINYTIQAENSYIGAVIEHSPTVKDTAEDTILTNLEYLRGKVEEAHKQNVQIVVFPEYALTTRFIDDNLEEYAINVNEDSHIITELRDMAAQYKTYIVANLIEKSTDNNNKTVYYNTNLVFDTNRNIIAKYRKINVFEEPKLTAGTTPVMFNTNFNVTFGLISSADLLSDIAIRDIIKTGVLEILCPSAWSSIMPFYTSLSLHHGYAQANGINLLVASYNYPTEGYGGSGIYLADGTIAETFIDGARSTKLLIRQIEKASELNYKYPLSCDDHQNHTVHNTLMSSRRTIIITPNITNYLTRKVFNSNNYRFKNVDLNKTNQTEEICSGDFCCKFTINIDLANTNEMYKFMIYDGNVKLNQTNNDEINVKICSLLSCKSNNIDSCGERINGTTRFNSISINGNLPFNNNRTFYQPITLKYDMKPIEQTTYCGSENDKHEWVMELRSDLTPQDGILVFGMLGYNSSNFVTPLQWMFVVIVTIIIKYL